MPDVDGFQATAEWRRREGAGPRLPIVAMTAGVLATDRDRCTAAGMDGFVPKPIDVNLLEGTMLRWTDRAQEAGLPLAADDDHQTVSPDRAALVGRPAAAGASGG